MSCYIEQCRIESLEKEVKELREKLAAACKEATDYLNLSHEARWQRDRLRKAMKDASRWASAQPIYAKEILDEALAQPEVKP